MKITFVQRDVYDYFGLMQLIANLERAGHECDAIVDFSDEAIVKRLEKSPPGLTGITCTAGVSYKDAISICTLINKRIPSTKTIIGGSYATLYPEIFESTNADFMCVGEADEAIVEVADALSKGAPASGILNIHTRNSDGSFSTSEIRSLVEDLDSLPIPDRRHHYAHSALKNQSRKNFVAGRGCPFSCSYCYVSTMRKIYQGKGQFVRYRSPAHLVEEIESIKKRYGMKYVGFMDDTFPTDSEWLEPFSKLYRDKVNLPFIAATRSESLNPERIRHLAHAGCDILSIGIETADEKLRSGILDRRGGDNSQLLSILEETKHAGMRLLTFNMLGIPGETLEDGWKTVELNATAKVDLPRFTVLTPSPGLKIADEAIRMDLCSEADIRATSTYLRKSVFRQRDIDSLVRLQKVAFAAVRLPALKGLWRFLARHAPAFILDLVYLFSNGMMFMDINKWSIPFALKYGRTVARWYD